MSDEGSMDRAKAESPELPMFSACSKKSIDTGAIMALGEHVNIQQKFQCYNCAMCMLCFDCWMPAPYEFHVYKKQGGSYTKALTMGEESTKWKRCICVQCAEYKQHTLPCDDNSVSDNLQLVMEKPYKIGICCCCEPEATVYHYDGEQNTKVGELKAPFQCLNHVIKIYVDDGGECKHAYTVGNLDCVSGCCGCHECRQSFVCCNDCYTCTYDIWEGEDQDACLGAMNKAPEGNKKVGKVIRRSQGCMGNCCYNKQANDWDIDFPADADWKRRAMLMQAVVFITHLRYSFK